MIFIIVTVDDIEGDTVGIAAPVPDGWLNDPSKAETLCFGACTMLQEHVRKSGAKLPLGALISMHLEER